MQRCPRCGVRNLDSDVICFNCDEALDGSNGKHAAAPSAVPSVVPVPVPVPEARRVEVPDVAKPERPVRKTSFFGLVLGALLYKLFLLVLAFGLFSIVVLLVIWLAYNNTAAAMVSFGVLALGAGTAFIYPDIARARLNGRKGGFVALVSDLVILGVFLPPILVMVEKKVPGAAGYVLDYYWIVIALLAEAFLIGFLFGYRAWRAAK